MVRPAEAPSLSGAEYRTYDDGSVFGFSIDECSELPNVYEDRQFERQRQAYRVVVFSVGILSELELSPDGQLKMTPTANVLVPHPTPTLSRS